MLTFKEQPGNNTIEEKKKKKKEPGNNTIEGEKKKKGKQPYDHKFITS